MTKRVKLTKPQRELLEAITNDGMTIHSAYKPAIRLVELGFAEFISRPLSEPTIQITPAGRAYLEPSEITSGASDNLKGETA